MCHLVKEKTIMCHILKLTVYWQLIESIFIRTIHNIYKVGDSNTGQGFEPRPPQKKKRSNQEPLLYILHFVFKLNNFFLGVKLNNLIAA